jgi:hypothetical protein
METCVQKDRITNIEKDAQDIRKTLNGTNGILAIVTKQVEVTKEQGKNIDKLMKNVETLIIKDVETEKEKEVILRVGKENERYKRENKMYKRYLVTTMIAIFSLLMTMLGLLSI